MNKKKDGIDKNPQKPSENPQTPSPFFQIGKVLRPRGLTGELKIQIHTNITDVFISLKKVWIDGREFKVTASSIQNNFAYLRLDGIKDSDTADRLRDEVVYVTREQIKLHNDEILASDLIGFTVINEQGKTLGTLKEIYDYGAGDIFDCGDFSFPNEDEFVLETNMTERKIIIKELLPSEEIR